VETEEDDVMKLIGRVLSGVVLALPLAVTPAFAQSNAQAQNQIMNRLQSDPTLSDDKIEVRVDGKLVTLKGKVDSDAERLQAVKLAHVQGIDVVDDQLKVGSSGVKNVMEDSAITATLKTQYTANSTLRGETISVDTNNGVVTLKGTVKSEATRRMAVDLAQTTDGVKRVEDQLVIVPPKL
jgi:hyperosmotically inducible protein